MPTPVPLPTLINALTQSLLAARPDSVDDLQARAVETLGKRWRWLRPLAQRYVAAFGSGKTRPRRRDVVQFLFDDEGFRRARARHRDQLAIASWLNSDAPSMHPVAAAGAWNLPALTTAGDLADWLALSTGELEWLADRKGLAEKQPHFAKLGHYHYRLVTKRTGGVRLIETPKPLLKDVQRRILSDILDRVPPHAAAHGFVKGRSIVSFAAPHAGQQLVLRLDLQDFFPGCPAARVQAVFRTFGYPDAVADLLAGLCTNRVPRSVWGAPPADRQPWSEARLMHAYSHLPQGAPTSPAMANIIAYRLDCRLSALAAAAQATYTRYADDLAFSGSSETFRRNAEAFLARAAAIAMEEGFRVNHRKTRLMPRSERQHLAGLVVNEKPGIRRRDLERLEAILTNCVRHGPESQNREQHPDFRSHLAGLLGFVQMVDPGKAHGLRERFEAIVWQ